jgi:RNA-directed DNA polymerase
MRGALGQIVRKRHGAPPEALIERLNPLIRGWTHYDRTVVAKETFSACDCKLHRMLRHWTRHQPPHKSARWISRQDWAVDQGEGWRFTAPNGSVLVKHAATPIKRFVKVKGSASPYDGNLLYWGQRLKQHPLGENRTGYLLKLQQGKCAYCGLTFTEGALLEIDPIIPRRLGGEDRLGNLQLLHRHGHDQKTAKLENGGPGINENDHLSEEPCARKRTSTVLERGRRR